MTYYGESSFYYKVKCDKCSSVIGTHTKKNEKAIEKAKAKKEEHQGCGGTLTYLETNLKNTKIVITESPNTSTKQGTDTNIRTEPNPLTPISKLYNELKLDSIKKSTCKGCKLNPDKCSKSPEMLAICQVESLEYRLRSGKYNIGTGTGKFAEDINGVIIDGVPVSVKDIWRLFIARTDTFSLYEAEDFGKQVVRAPETKRPPTDEDILQSLSGKITIGFRPVNPETNMCKWICYDIDKHSCEETIYKANPRQAVDEIIKLLKKWYALTGYIELSGSPDSYHIWVFIEPTDNDIVIKFDKEFWKRCDPSINKAICKRVETGQGHMIKLPYTINIKNDVRSKFMEGIDISKIQPEKFKFKK
ncbi:MAG: hypothetical protein A2W22_02445 [Candidatus Levybacteria bacterium RBG_16_35_11]|nr:MAG: hypothetical protein A2W22_02445 [Candidatus Levybacteria bacterium RBG_16_35_11]